MLIQLTDFEDGDPCLVQTDAIVCAVTEKRQGGARCTFINFGLDSYVRVRETPVEVYEAIQSKEWEAIYEPEEETDEAGC